MVKACTVQGALLVGFSKEDGDAVSAWLQQMEPGFLLSHCTPDMLKGTVQDAVYGEDKATFRMEAYTMVDEPLPRLVLLSGMTGEEAIALAEHWDMFTGARTSFYHYFPSEKVCHPILPGRCKSCEARDVCMLQGRHHP